MIDLNILFWDQSHLNRDRFNYFSLCVFECCHRPLYHGGFHWKMMDWGIRRTYLCCALCCVSMWFKCINNGLGSETSSVADLSSWFFKNQSRAKINKHPVRLIERTDLLEYLSPYIVIENLRVSHNIHFRLFIIIK